MITSIKIISKRYCSMCTIVHSSDTTNVGTHNSIRANTTDMSTFTTNTLSIQTNMDTSTANMGSHCTCNTGYKSNKIVFIRNQQGFINVKILLTVAPLRPTAGNSFLWETCGPNVFR